MFIFFAPMTTDSALLVDVRDHIAHVTLNRPAALNALTHDMIRSLATHLRAWEQDANVRAIVVRGAGEKAFCAGGDIRALYEAGKRGESDMSFFIDEYRLNYEIHTYFARTSKPYVAWIDGIVMGGGMGISQGASIRIVGDRTKMAMPETLIGMFPDVGGTYFLSRAPGAIGLYLGLTGQTIKAADALYAGLATHYVATARAAEFDAALAANSTIHAALEAFATSPAEPATLPLLRALIDKHFADKADVPAILASLASETTAQEWAAETIKTLNKRSPTMLAVSHRAITRGRSICLADCFRIEIELTRATFAHGDVLEGIRALVIDKDHAPKWKPATLAEVSPARVEDFFTQKWQPHPLADIERC